MTTLRSEEPHSSAWASVRPANTASLTLVAQYGFRHVDQQWDDDDLLLGHHQRHAPGRPMTADHQAHRGSGWEAMQRTLAADAVVAEALLYASGGRRLTVEHGQPLTDQAGVLLQRLVDDQAAAGAGHLGGGTVTGRPTSITWTFPSTTVSARRLVLAAQEVADRLNPGGWIVSADDY